MDPDPRCVLPRLDLIVVLFLRQVRCMRQERLASENVCTRHRFLFFLCFFSSFFINTSFSSHPSTCFHFFIQYLTSITTFIQFLLERPSYNSNLLLCLLRRPTCCHSSSSLLWSALSTPLPMPRLWTLPPRHLLDYHQPLPQVFTCHQNFLNFGADTLVRLWQPMLIEPLSRLAVAHRA